MAEAHFAAAATAVRDAAEALALPDGDAVTQFEALTAAAFWGFREAAGADALVIEAGLGGRYDATNVLPAGRRGGAHQHRPGAHRAARRHRGGDRGREAGRGARRLGPAGGGPLSPARRAAPWTAECARRGLRPLRYGAGLSAREGAGGVDVVTPRAVYTGLPLALHGAFQRDNLAVALAGAEMLLGGAARSGAPAARRWPRCACPAGWSWSPARPAVVLDGAHNPAGMEAMARSLPEVIDGRRPAVAVVSVLGDKDAAAMVAALAPVVDLVVATRSSHARAVRRRRPGRARAGRRGAAGRSRTPRRPSPRRARGPAPRGSSWWPVACICWRICGRGSWRGSRTPLLHSRAPRGASPQPRRTRPSWERYQIDPVPRGAGLGLRRSSSSRPLRVDLELLRLRARGRSRVPAAGLRVPAVARPHLLDLPGRAAAHRVARASSPCRSPCSVVIPFLGSIIYLIIRPPEYLDEARERELELLALEQRLGELGDAEGQEIVGKILAREGFTADPGQPAALAAPGRRGLDRRRARHRPAPDRARVPHAPVRPRHASRRQDGGIDAAARSSERTRTSRELPESTGGTGRPTQQHQRHRPQPALETTPK